MESLLIKGAFTNEQKQALMQGLHETDTDQTEDMNDVLREFRKNMSKN
nr:hypothetical protein [uncultured Flavobacterium sp.]